MASEADVSAWYLADYLCHSQLFTPAPWPPALPPPLRSLLNLSFPWTPTHSLNPSLQALPAISFREGPFSSHPAKQPSPTDPRPPTPFFVFITCHLLLCSSNSVFCFSHSNTTSTGKGFCFTQLPLGQYCLRAEIQPVDKTSLRAILPLSVRTKQAKYLAWADRIDRTVSWKPKC